jgi:hypothetical protein
MIGATADPYETANGEKMNGTCRQIPTAVERYFVSHGREPTLFSHPQSHYCWSKRIVVVTHGCTSNENYPSSLPQRFLGYCCPWSIGGHFSNLVFEKLTRGMGLVRS